ncbi:MAG: hypothetical protein IJF73_00840 [Clostridia bacterium]|nr:hypothetical protein [Clostridia bacterium]
MENSDRGVEKEGFFGDAKIKLLTVSTVLPVENSKKKKAQILHFANLTEGKRKKDQSK